MVNVGSSEERGSCVYVGVDVGSGELVAVSNWQLTSSIEHATEPEHVVDRQTQVFVVVVINVVIMFYFSTKLALNAVYK